LVKGQRVRFHHSGWTTEDGRYLFICDEDAEHPAPDITVWDISDVGNPELVGEYADAGATVHNLYVIGDYAFTSYYTAGFRILDISDPTQPQLLDQFDTAPTVSGESLSGAFGVYPFSQTGHVYVSDEFGGLFVFSLTEDPPTHVDTPPGSIVRGFSLHQNYPNPFNPLTTIEYVVAEESHVDLRIYNLQGQEVKTLVNDVEATGSKSVSWDGTDASGRIVSADLYTYRLNAGGFVESRRMLFLK
jgi:hypothetical protein